ncbi:cation:dicarboxylate symporter family transporter [Corynebacterium sp. c24U_166]|uniref:cation:dicarboxylate symporter family transporter n=1 Tax=Corynebacterium sp. c24U_166 TaxID=2913505 RepID=UPI0022B9F481|nr:cation:dicarboxylase symporter family transporter [Corynebacterium sp. c24U_166]MCZ9303812.1 cation:dicarboxylase symporter family transporter [Corynebacterium sp. c24U_166]
MSSSPVRIVEPKKEKKDKSHWLYISVIVAVLAGVILGLVAPDVAVKFELLGKLFVALIKMMIAPVIFCTIVLGIGSVRAAASVGRAGAISLVYFIVMSTFALAIGLIVGNIVKPGSSLAMPEAGSGMSFVDNNKESAHGLSGFVMSVIPDTLFSSLTSGSVLQALFIALLCGFAIQSMGRAGEPLLSAIAQIQKLVFKVLMMVLWTAPVGAFGAISWVVGSTGFDAVKQLVLLMLCFYVTCVIFIFGVLGLVLYTFTRFNIFKLVKYLAREYLLIFATSSSESALPTLIRKMEHVGVDKSTVGIVVPTGHSFNLDGTAIYLTMASIFISDAMHKPLNLGEQIGLLVFMMIASKGAAGVSGAGLATLAGGLQAHRAELLDGVGIIAGIDRFMSEARALTNFAGNSVATLVVGVWTHTVDRNRVNAVLSGEIPYVETPEDMESDVNLRNPSVKNPADKLQPTPQVNVDDYQRA